MFKNPIIRNQYRSKTNSLAGLGTSRGFTIVETLVAIAVLMIAITGPLVIASKGLTAALYSKDQMIASFLAQESMEIIKNLRDSAINENENTADWLDNFIGVCGNGGTCDAGPLNGSGFLKVSCGNPNDGGCDIYLDPNTGYSSDSNGGTKTIFKRYFYLEDLPTPDSVQKIVHVVVTWNVGSLPFQTEITGLLTNQTR